MPVTTFRGRQITDANVLDAMARYEPVRLKRYAIKHEGSEYSPKQILRLILPDIGGFPGGEATNRVFRQLGFTIGEIDDDDAATTDDVIEEAIETKLHLESDLEGFLVADLGQLEEGLKLYSQDDIRGQQFNAGVAGRIDILATDANDDLVVIELKAGDADHKTAGQIQAYMGWVGENMAAGRHVRGFLVASAFTERLKLAAKVVPGLSLKQYSVIFRFREP